MTPENKIKKLAYNFYIKRGRKNGYALDDWLKAERIILRHKRFKKVFFSFIKYLIISGILSSGVMWFLQQKYLRKQEILNKKLEIIKIVLPIYASYYQETWNQWYAFRDKKPSEEYRKNIQRLVVEAKSIEIQIPILFKDKKIYENWKQLLHIFWEANYPISREGISEQQLNEMLNRAAPLIDDILNRMYWDFPLYPPTLFTSQPR